MSWWDWFLPHKLTHQKAKLLSWHYLLIYFLLFTILRASFNLVDIYKPGVLGISSQISVGEVIEDTNLQRQKLGLSTLKENAALSAAARAKAANMFEENYWAHFSPSGKDPWGFIKNTGYKFSYAGENLARNFQTSQDVVTAWMNSPSHRDNILNSHYQDIGIAVLDGNLQGQRTTLVVQMFGSPLEAVATVPSENLNGVNAEQPKMLPAKPEVLPKPVVTLDPFALTKILGIFLTSFIALLLALDFIILKKRGVFRISSHHFAHLGFLAVLGASIFFSHAGEIL